MLDEETITDDTPIVDDGTPIDENPNEETPTEETPTEESTSIISIEELKKRLRLAGVDYSQYTDEDLQALIDLTLESIEAETGLPIINPRLITEYEDFFHSKVYETDYYPLLCCELRIDGDIVEAHRVDMNRGILYFKPGIRGDLEVNYKIQYTNVNVLSSLITNMIILGIEGDVVHGTWNSIKEEGVSVTYGAGSGGLQDKVDDALRELSSYYTPRVRLL